MKFSLIVVSNTTPVKEIPIRLPEFVIGRDPECHLRPASPMISKKHCAFVTQGEQVLFRDFGSTNGSFVNDVKVEGEVYLQDGDTVKFGPLVFKAKLQATASMPSLSTVVTGTEKTVVEKTSEPVIVDKTVVQQKALPKMMTSNAQSGRRAGAVEDDIAAMLFNFADAPSGSIPSDEIPLGSTIAGVAVDPTPADEMPALTEEQRRADDRKKAADAKKAANSASTSSAAEAILQKYMRRPRV